MNVPDNTSKTPNRLNTVYARVVIGISVCLYTGLVLTLATHDGGGGQQLLPGYNMVMAVAVGGASILLLIIQLLLYRLIRKRSKMPAAGLLLPLPVALAAPAFLGFSGRPENLTLVTPTFVCILVTAAVFFAALRWRKKAIWYAAFACLAVPGFLLQSGISAVQIAKTRERHVLDSFEHTQQQLRADIERRCAGWNAAGTQATAFIYVDKKRRVDSECYYHSNGCVMTKIYRYDSQGQHYEREISFTENTFPYLRRLRNTGTNESTTIEYFKDTPLIAKQIRVFDSNAVLYSNRNIFRKNGSLQQAITTRISSVTPH